MESYLAGIQYDLATALESTVQNYHDHYINNNVFWENNHSLLQQDETLGARSRIGSTSSGVAESYPSEHQSFGLRFNPLENIFRPTQLEATSGLNGEVKSSNELHAAVSLYDLVRTDSRDYYHFFDAELFASSVLNNEPYHSISGNATQNLSAGDVGLVLSKLNIGIEEITKRLRSELPYMTHFSQPRLVSSRSKQMLKDYKEDWHPIYYAGGVS
ncbi:hypothetical protein PPACK8108_LOCUS15422 [Phakopsora pachyrhizi]|uniref:Uncharacterized protein n=1 Tax=Phakopsora pachyrhizi TaxID=170000 RepID=A0AAV0BBJ2_PHAPC|nr:hypothetical protein PPACK8108_LOCUS15422 [Phakopsora pachyrhizi]